MYANPIINPHSASYVVILGMYVLNVPASLLHFFSHISGYESVYGVIVAGVYAVVGPSVAFFAWHMLLYRGLEQSQHSQKLIASRPHFIAYTAMFAVQLLVLGLSAAGLVGGSGGGVITMLDALLKGHIVAGVFASLVTVLCAFAFLLGAVQMRQALVFYRDNSVKEAHPEATLTTAQSPV